MSLQGRAKQVHLHAAYRRKALNEYFQDLPRNNVHLLSLTCYSGGWLRVHNGMKREVTLGTQHQNKPVRAVIMP